MVMSAVSACVYPGSLPQQEVLITLVCGNTIANSGKPAKDDDCNMPCNGNKTELCGGTNHFNMYDFGLQFSEGKAHDGPILETRTLTTAR